MTHTDSNTVRLKVSAEIARIVKPGAPRDVQLAAARGALPLAVKDLLTVLFFLCSSQDVEIRNEAVTGLRTVPASSLAPALQDESLPSQLLDLLARARMNDRELMDAVIVHPATAVKTLALLAGKGPRVTIDRLVDHENLLQKYPQLIEAIIANPAADPVIKEKLGWQDPARPDLADARLDETEETDLAEAASYQERSQEELESLMFEAEESNLSKYQIALQLEVADKIKIGMTGDKEWRSILIKEANKLVQTAVMKNPRITDAEVLQIAKNKSCSDEIIRLILLNKDWLKNYEIRKALVTHPKTPLPKALRFVGSLGMKDIKDLARSRQVSNIIANAARKELEQRIKKSGG